MLQKFLTILLALGWSVSTVNAAGQSKDAEGGWQFLVEPYGFLPSVPLTTANGDSLEISKQDIVENLDFAFFLLLGARKDKWSVYLDTIRFDLAGDDSASRAAAGLPGDPTVNFDTDIGVEGWLVTLTGTYAVFEDERTRLEMGGGVRYYHEELSFELDVGPATEKAEYSWNLWDGVFVTRGFTDLNDRWYVSYYADASTGGTDLTYQLSGALNYRFEDFTLVGGYRYIKWEFEEDDDAPGSIADDQVAKGPFVGFKFFF
jgi:hypothetical protein